MRSSAIVTLALAAAVAPAMASSSFGPSSHARRASSDVFARADYEDVLARSFGSDFVQGFEKGFTGTLKTLAPIALSFLKREDVELLARTYPSHIVKDSRGNYVLSRSFGSDFVQGFKKGFTGTLETLGPIALSFLKREDVELLARTYPSHVVKDAHGNYVLARSFGSDFVDGFKKGFTGTLKTLAPIALSFLKREDIELLARAYVETNTARSLNDLD